MTLQNVAEALPPRLRRAFLRHLGWWPPFLGAGIRVRDLADDDTWLEVEMPLRPWTRNYVGTHFGGSLYAMCDPFFMLLLMNQLGPDHLVWDKQACIEFRRPGRGMVRARFEMPPERVEAIRVEAAAGAPVEPCFEVDVTGPGGLVVAHVTKRLWVRRRT